MLARGHRHNMGVLVREDPEDGRMTCAQAYWQPEKRQLSLGLGSGGEMGLACP